MMTPNPFCRPAACLFALLLLLASCSAPQAVATAPTVAVVNGKVTRGVITASRPVTYAAATQTGVNGVLTALQEPAPQSAVTATEYVVRRSDDSSVTIVTSTGSFSMGDRVEIIDGTPPQLLPAN